MAKMPTRNTLLFLLAMLPFASTARAADADPDKSAYTLLNPTPESALRSLATDRPTKTNTPITVDAGHVQVETDLANYSYGTFQGTKTRTVQALDPSLKLGITNSIDLEAQVGGYQSVVAGDGMGGIARSHGFGDVTFRAKINFIGNDGGDLAIAAIPYVKAASGVALISNGATEGGVIIPIQYQLPSDFSLVVTTEFDALKNALNTGRHANFVNVINISHPVPGIKDLTFAAEFWSSVSAEKISPNLYTADFALAYLINPRLQVDVGLNVGLNDAAPAVQVYSGVSFKF